MKKSKIFSYNLWSLKNISNMSEDLMGQSQGALESSLCGFYCFDTYLESIVKNSIFTHKYEHLKMGESLQEEWLVANLLNYDLFSSPSDADGAKVMIINAEKINKKVQLFITENHHNFVKKVHFVFSKNCDFFKKLSTLGFFFELTPLKPWESVKYFYFLLLAKNIKVSNSCKQISFDGLDMQYSDYVRLVNEIEIDLEKKSITSKVLEREFLNNILNNWKADIFGVVAKLISKNYKGYYQELLKRSESPDDLRKLAIFIQGHLIKVCYPSYQKSKNKISRYDRGISAANAQWSAAEIKETLDELSELEVQSKISSKNLKRIIQCKLTEIRK